MSPNSRAPAPCACHVDPVGDVSAPPASPMEVELFTEGDVLYAAMLASIKCACRFVRMESYIFAGDEIGWEFAVSRRLWRVINHHVGQARAQESHAEVRVIGVDETASKRGQTYISVFYDLDAQRLLFATPGRDKATLGKFASDLTEHGGQPTAITHVSMDMSGSFQAGAAEHFPAAEVCFDRFHVVALSSTALDEVRRAEVKSEPELKGTRWGLHKKPADWTVKQTETMHWLQRSNLKTGLWPSARKRV
jgi:hypothetical protein